jgi:hypothetical protein
MFANCGLSTWQGLELQIEEKALNTTRYIIKKYGNSDIRPLAGDMDTN